MLVSLVLSTTLAAAASPVVAAAGSSSALDAFAGAWSAIDGYSATLAMHETSGTNVQDRTYAYTFRKPSDATIVITQGPGRGGKVVWTGGDSVTGSPPGLLSGLKVRLGIADPKVTSLRGDTVAMASFAWILDHFEHTPGALSDAPGAPLDGAATTDVSLAVADPAADGGLTREVLTIANATKLPVDVRRYAGAALVKEIRFSNVDVQRGPASAPAPRASNAATRS